VASKEAFSPFRTFLSSIQAAQCYLVEFAKPSIFTGGLKVFNILKVPTCPPPFAASLFPFPFCRFLSTKKIDIGNQPASSKELTLQRGKAFSVFEGPPAHVPAILLIFLRGSFSKMRWLLSLLGVASLGGTG
jgi:hypothetical protein